MHETRPDGSDPDEPARDDARVERWLATQLPSLRGFLRRRADDIVLERESVEDLAQSVCREAVEHVEDGRLELRGERAFKQWLYEAALFKLKARARYHRAQRRDAGREVPLERGSSSGAPRELGGSETPSRLVATAEQRAEVRRAIEALGGRDAEVLRLAVLEELPHAAVAAQLGVSEAHSRVLLSRALAKLGRALGA